MKRVASSLVLVLAAACAPLPPDEASNESRQVQEIVRNTASPFCPGKTLDSCPSPRAAEWRRDVHHWVEEGVPEPEIRQRLQARVPEFDLSIPPVKWGWLIPVLALTLSTLWFVVMARRFRSRSRPQQSRPASDARDELDARLDQELAELD